MNHHDTSRNIEEERKLLEKLSPQFNDLTMDVQEILKLSENPAMLGVLLFKLAEERRKANELMEKIYDKYDNIMLHLKTKAAFDKPEQPSPPQILPEPDRKIMDLTQINGSTSAKEVQEALGYKGRNAACQRLNKLCQAGYLKKVRSGKKVLYLP